MITDQVLFFAGLVVTALLICGFFFTAYEFNQLDESNEKHYRHDDSTDVNFKE